MNRLLVIPLLVLGLGACAPESPDSGAQAVSHPGYPRTIATFDENELILARPPERIIPANAAALEILVDLGQIERVVAVPAPAFDYGNIELDREAWKPRTFAKYLVEPMLAARPDLVLTNPWQNPETTSFLAGSGIAVLNIPEPKSFDDLLEAIRVTARVLDVTPAGDELCELLSLRHAALQKVDRQHIRAMTYTTFGTGSWTAASDTSADLLLRFAGMRNASAEHGLEGHAPIDIETLLAIDPDYIVVGGSAEDPRWSTTLETMRGDPALESLRALKEGHVVVLPLKHFTANSHYLLQAAEGLAAMVD